MKLTLRIPALAILVLAILAPAPPAMSQPVTDHLQGQRVAHVIDQFRAAGYPFAYSTGLVTDSMTVVDEPSGSTAVEIVRQILEPYNLTLRAEEGLYLVVRASRSSGEIGSLLVVVRDARDLTPLQRPGIESVPDLPAAEVRAPPQTAPRRRMVRSASRQRAFRWPRIRVKINVNQELITTY